MSAVLLFVLGIYFTGKGNQPADTDGLWIFVLCGIFDALRLVWIFGRESQR